jgi:hypothetical protein
MSLAPYGAPLMALAALLPSGPFKPSPDPNVGLFGALHLQGQHHLLPLHLAPFVTTHQSVRCRPDCKSRFQARG